MDARNMSAYDVANCLACVVLVSWYFRATWKKSGLRIANITADIT
jgi:hypothetical protein